MTASSTSLFDEYYNDLSDDSDCVQEFIVNKTDGREIVYEFAPEYKEYDIYQCIGQIVVTFDYFKEYKYRLNAKGTGTVIFVKKDVNGEHIAYVITCAHNVRHGVWECTQCKQLRETKHKYCFSCNQGKHEKSQRKKMLKANKISFKRRSIMPANCGQTLYRYDHCKVEYIDDLNYEMFTSVKDGYDWAMISFIDKDKFYADKYQNILLEHGKNAFSQNTDFAVFGYPDKHNDQMFGMKSNSIKQLQVVTQRNKTGKEYLYQTAIDTQYGQSGSVFFYKRNKKAVIVAIHVGGGTDKTIDKYNPVPFNVATLIDDSIICKLNMIKNNQQMTDKSMIDDVKSNNDETLVINTVGMESVWVECNGDNTAKYILQIQLKNDFNFVDREVEYAGEETEIGGLHIDCQYIIRFICREKTEQKEYATVYSPVKVFKTQGLPQFVDASEIIKTETDINSFKQILVNNL
eukprot:242225_1